MRKWSARKKLTIGVILTGLIVWFALCLPDPLFNDPLSTILNDRNGKLMGAKIADDGQWRFPEADSIPYKFRIAVRYYEDEYFYSHPGINPVSMAKALWSNLGNEKRRGGSTLTAQTIRLSRKGQSRTYYEKLIESILAIRLEFSYSKEEILSLYSSYAPFGGNVVGLDAASWRYYGREAHLLSWGEVATLAVLPNSPSLIYPGKNQELLLKKRNRLLDKLLENGELDSLSCELAKSEPLPGKPLPLPRLSSHLLETSIIDGGIEQRINSTLHREWQERATALVQRHSNALSSNQIHNAAMIVVDIESMDVLAYVGNSKGSGEGHDVDIIRSERSSGSILKPFLYAMSQQDGLLSPKALLPDIPTQIAGYSPLNFDKTYDGAVPAHKALARSLNIPAVRTLQKYGLRKFTKNISEIGFSTIRNSADHYGLSLILGGAEVRLWDLAEVYGNLARQIHYSTSIKPEHKKLSYHSKSEGRNYIPKVEISDGPIWLMLEALSDMDRPIEGTEWSSYESSQKIAWKTGTSYGHRDAWAVGITPKYLVGVWVGNADGEGRPGLTGANSAAPIMFNAFKFLPVSAWFDTPEYDLIKYPLCQESGYKAGMNCPNKTESWTSNAIERTELCPYHQTVHLDESSSFQVNSTCYPPSKMVSQSWFILPPIMEWFYKKRNSNYKELPKFLTDCQMELPFIDLIYPQWGQKVYIPTGFEGREKLVFKATHRTTGAILYWHLDNTYLGSTRSLHEIELDSQVGPHTLTLMDESGNVLTRRFEIVDK